MYHNFFIHSSVDRYLGCFQVLAIVNGAAMNVGVHVFFWFSQGICTVVDCWVIWYFIPSFLKKISILFFIVAISADIPTSGARGFPFLHIVSSICLFVDS